MQPPRRGWLIVSIVTGSISPVSLSKGTASVIMCVGCLQQNNRSEGRERCSLHNVDPNSLPEQTSNKSDTAGGHQQWLLNCYVDNVCIISQTFSCLTGFISSIFEQICCESVCIISQTFWSSCRISSIFEQLCCKGVCIIISQTFWLSCRICFQHWLSTSSLVTPFQFWNHVSWPCLRWIRSSDLIN